MSYPVPEPTDRPYPVQDDQRSVSTPPPLPPDGVPTEHGHIPGAGPGGMQYATSMQHGEVTETGVPSDGLGTDQWEPVIGPDGITDFTPRKPRPTFKLNGETYHGKIEVPTGPMLAYGMRQEAIAKQKGDAWDQWDENQATIEMLRLMLVKESADRLVYHLHMPPREATSEDLERITEEADNDAAAIGMETFGRILPWLSEQYGMRPTQPSSDSASGSPNPDDGTRSTDPEPTSSDSGSTGLSTPST